jgi:UDP-N-acetylmuramate--alanine ligase
MATLAGARRAFGRRLVVVFQPHRYTRTRDLLSEFATAFNDADVLMVLGIYAASEEPIPGISGEALAQAIRSHGHRDVTHVERRVGCRGALLPRLREGDLVVTLGAGT